MANIRKLYEADQTTQLMPQTHEKAVIDNNGTTAETKFQMITDLVNQKQMEIGAVPSDLTPTAGSTNWVTSGGLYNNIYAPTENVIFENSDEITWSTGNVNGSGKLVSTYANKYIILNINEDYDYIVINKASSSFILNIYKYTTKYEFLNIGSTVLNNVKITEKYNKLLLLLYDKPSDAQAQAETITVTLVKENQYIRKDAIASVENGITNLLLTTANNGIIWEQGGIDAASGYEESNSNAIRSGFIDLHGGTAHLHIGSLSGQTGFCVIYDEHGYKSGISLVSDADVTSGSYVRFVFYGSTITPDAGANSGNYVLINMNVNEKLIEQEKKYYNPVYRADFPDPTVWNGEDGYYYSLATGPIASRAMIRSANLVDWENTLDIPYTAETAAIIASTFGATDYWAPCVVKIKPDQWNLYLSAPSGIATHRGIAVLKSSHPTIGYELVNFFSATFNDYIDPCVARDEKNRVWMFAGSNAMMFRRQLTDDGLDFAENSEWVHVAGRPQGETGNTDRIKTFEGEYLYRRKGYWYLFMTSGPYDSYKYAMRVVRSAIIDGDFVDKEGNLATDGYAETIKSTPSGTPLYGPGHNSEIITDRDGRTWILYHAHWVKAVNGTRELCLDEVLWDENGWPYFAELKPSVMFNKVPNL